MINKILNKFRLSLSSFNEIEDRIKEQFSSEKIRLLKNPVIDQKSFQLLQDNPVKQNSKLLKGRFWYVVKCVTLKDQKFVWHINLRMIKIKGMSIKSPNVFMRAEHAEATAILNGFVDNRGGSEFDLYKDEFAYYCDKYLTNEELEVLEFYNPKIAKTKINGKS